MSRRGEEDEEEEEREEEEEEGEEEGSQPDDLLVPCVCGHWPRSTALSLHSSLFPVLPVYMGSSPLGGRGLGLPGEGSRP